MLDLEFWSRDQKFGLKVEEKEIHYILQMCASTNGNETGGILVGLYNNDLDCAIVTAVSAKPSDSKSGRTWFNRGVRGLKKWIEQLWLKERHYYLGEWHFHPYGSAIPSFTDKEQMKSISNSPYYRCPEPILLIVGGDPKAEWDVKVFVFPKEQGPMELYKKENSTNINVSSEVGE